MADADTSLTPPDDELFEAKVNFIVGEGDSSKRLDAILSSKYSILNRLDWQDRIRLGKITVDGQVAKAGKRLNVGQQIEISFQKKAEPIVAENYRIVFEDDFILVIDKPANLPVHPSGKYNVNTLLGLLRKDRGDSFKGHFIHRIDRETSGLILLAKTPASASVLHKSLLSGTFTKNYFVVVEGEFPNIIDASGFLTLGGSEVKKKKIFLYEDPGRVSESAKTIFKRIAFHENLGVSSLKAELFTGRTHQIRATLCSLGFPLVGDRLYGVDETLYLKFIHGTEDETDRLRLRMGRTALHSHTLGFEHPEGGFVTFEAEIPRDIRGLLESG